MNFIHISLYKMGESVVKCMLSDSWKFPFMDMKK